MRIASVAFKNIFQTNIDVKIVKLNSPVEKIVWNGTKDNHAIVITDTERYKAKKVLVTTSVAYLKKNNMNLFQPRLPESMLLSLEVRFIEGLVLVYYSSYG